MSNDSTLKMLSRPEACAIGDQIWAPWGADGFLYPAIVVATIDAVQSHVAYLDGDEGPVTLKETLYGSLQVGNQVSVNYKGLGDYYVGTIVKIIGMAVEVDYEDGDHGFTTIAQCRLPLAFPRSS